MSWFSDLADKAENLLNKIDQNAAIVLQETERKIHSNFSSALENKTTSDESSYSPSIIAISEVNLSPKQNVLKGKSLKRNVNRNYDKNETSSQKSFDLRPSSSLRQSRSDGNFNTIVKIDIQNAPELPLQKDDPVILSLENDSVIETSSVASDHGFHFSEDGNMSVTSNNSDHFVNMENEMLRNEISVVNNEVSLLIAKAKNAEKDSENKSLRLHQLERAHTITVDENENLKERIVELQRQTKHLPKKGLDRTDLEDAIRILEDEKSELIQKVEDLQLSEMSNASIKIELGNDLKEKGRKCEELEEKLEKVKTEMVELQSEWKNYKIRANSTLMMKEKIIEELGGSGGENIADSTLNSQISQLKLERDDMATESSKYQAICEKKCKEIEQLEIRTTSTERQLSALREIFRQEKAAKEIAEHTVLSLSKELKSMQHETAKQISSLRTKLRESQPKENEHLLSHPVNSMNVSETGEERFRLLTQALVAKQAALESITSDRNALRLQLEKTENKYRSDLISMKNNQPRIIHVNDTDDVCYVSAKARLPPMMQENPWDSNLSRRVKKAYSTLDSFSVRVGIFLRRNPIARIFIISYMIILHFWVMVVLFTYTPEIH